MEGLAIDIALMQQAIKEMGKDIEKLTAQTKELVTFYNQFQGVINLFKFVGVSTLFALAAIVYKTFRP